MDNSKLDNSAKDGFNWLKAYEIYRVEGTKIIRELIVPNDDELIYIKRKLSKPIPTIKLVEEYFD